MADHVPTPRKRQQCGGTSLHRRRAAYRQGHERRRAPVGVRADRDHARKRFLSRGVQAAHLMVRLATTPRRKDTTMDLELELRKWEKQIRKMRKRLEEDPTLAEDQRFVEETAAVTRRFTDKAED